MHRSGLAFLSLVALAAIAVLRLSSAGSVQEVGTSILPLAAVASVALLVRFLPDARRPGAAMRAAPDRAGDDAQDEAVPASLSHERLLRDCMAEARLGPGALWPRAAGGPVSEAD